MYKLGKSEVKLQVIRIIINRKEILSLSDLSPAPIHYSGVVSFGLSLRCDDPSLSYIHG
jgi:hypothetical protein